MKLHGWEPVRRSTEGKLMTWRLAVPGGWMYTESRELCDIGGNGFALSSVFVPDPFAEHVKDHKPTSDPA